MQFYFGEAERFPPREMFNCFNPSLSPTNPHGGNLPRQESWRILRGKRPDGQIYIYDRTGNGGGLGFFHNIPPELQAFSVGGVSEGGETELNEPVGPFFAEKQTLPGPPQTHLYMFVL